MSADTASNTEIIYVHLLDEAVDVRRPVEAVAIRHGVCRLPRNPDPESETWEFEACDVAAERQDLGDGPAMVVVGRVGRPLRQPMTASRR